MAAGAAVALNEDTVEPEAEQQWQQRESWEFLAVYTDRQIKSTEMVEMGWVFCKLIAVAPLIRKMVSVCFNDLEVVNRDSVSMQTQTTN